MPSRWQDEKTADNTLKEFRHALVNALDAYFGRAQHYELELEQKFSVVHGSPGATTDIRAILHGAKTRREIALALEHLLQAAAEIPLAYGGITKDVDAVAKAIKDAIAYHPGIDLRLEMVNGTYELHPAGAPELDTPLVETTIQWLGRYPVVQEHARKSLQCLVEEDMPESLNSVRLALETLMRVVLGNNKTLENQIGSEASDDAPFLKWLREKGIKPQTVTMARRITSSICDLQNSWIKHPPATGASFDRPETEYAIYVAFSLMRLITQVA